MIEEYPSFSPLSLDQRTLLHARFQRLTEGMSELTFAGLYLFRETHHYRIARVGEDVLVVVGQDAEPFFILPFEFPSRDVLEFLFAHYGSMKAVMPSQAQRLAEMGLRVWEDRDNFDYLYARDKMATLAGRRLHRKKNLVNLFLRNNTCTAKPLLEEYAGDALQILDRWHEQQGSAGDYAAAREAIEKMEALQLCGGIFYVGAEPIAYTLGEELAQGRMFVVHFEKAVRRKQYTGVYQHVNRVFAAVLPEKYELINREQDLGDPGLRQAKESYRPVGFVKKYRAAKP
ncbi:MAG: phosphatidylglycerol lysyltransferase domain-containing protein [Planctomycetes bacterium]|jgi:hypothetical protein|nr:phosphatidylglycerol lysyltransferase domain-containing protein [Planctomycetota bacterium]